jgi:hypothetical protein
VHFYSFNILFFVARFIMSGDHNNLRTIFQQRFCQVVRPYGSTAVWNLKMLMKDHNFHPAKKGNQQNDSKA